jgi:hypothetical protein
VVTACAWLLFLVSAGALLVGGMATLFSLSPGTDMGDAYALVRVGPPLLGGGAFGMLLVRRLRQLRKPSASQEDTRPQSFASPLRELAWAAALIALAFGGTWFLFFMPPWSRTPLTVYGPYYQAEVVPLRIFVAVVIALLAIRFLPRLAALSLARGIFKPTHIAVLAMAGAFSVALRSYAQWAGIPAMPHVIVLYVLDISLAAVLFVAAIEAIAVDP